MSDSCPGGWCGKDFKPRVFKDRPVVICYDKPPATQVNRSHYDDLRYSCLLGKKILVRITTNHSKDRRCKQTENMDAVDSTVDYKVILKEHL